MMTAFHSLHPLTRGAFAGTAGLSLLLGWQALLPLHPARADTPAPTLDQRVAALETLTRSQQTQIKNLTMLVDSLAKKPPVPGPQGPQGAAGPKGDTGPQGPQGPAGTATSASLPAPFSLTNGGRTLLITGVNVQIVNGLGVTYKTNGLGNLILGYNENTVPDYPQYYAASRSGSHNLVLGQANGYSSYGSLVGGVLNNAAGPFSSVCGLGNLVVGYAGSVTGGSFNIVTGDFASITGGQQNTADGQSASVSGGYQNYAGPPTNGNGGQWASVSGGQNNTATGNSATVSGGSTNTAGGQWASVSGGEHNNASYFLASVSGGLYNSAAGYDSSVSGGYDNKALSYGSSVSGGQLITLNSASTVAAEWAAGSVPYSYYHSP